MEDSAHKPTPRTGSAALRYGVMVPTALYVLAEASPSNAKSDLVQVGAGLVTAFGVLGGIALFLFRGFWAKNIEPLIQNVIHQWWSSRDQMVARDIEVQKTIATWDGSPERHAQSESRIVGVIDNQIRRDDGLIHREIRAKLEAGMEPIHETLADLKRAAQQRDDEDRHFRQEVLTTLAQIQGAMGVSGSPFRGSTMGVGPKGPPLPPKKP